MRGALNKRPLIIPLGEASPFLKNTTRSLRESEKRRRSLVARDAFRRLPARAGASRSGQKGGGDNTLVCSRPPCGKSPTKDKRACETLRICISTLSKKGNPQKAQKAEGAARRKRQFPRTPASRKSGGSASGYSLQGGAVGGGCSGWG